MANQLSSFEELFRYVTEEFSEIEDISDEIKRNLAYQGHRSRSYICQGFDPKVCLAKLVKIKSATKKDDLYKLVYLFLAYGTNLNYIITKMTNESANIIKNLKQKYGILSSVKGIGRDALNLSRIAVSCPTITVTVLSKNPDINRPVTRLEMGLKVQGWPSVLLSKITASVVPHSHPDVDQILSCLVLYNAFETRKINKDASELTPTEVISESRKFVEISFNSLLIPENIRIQFCNTGVTEEAFTATTIMPVIIEGAKFLDALVARNTWY